MEELTMYMVFVQTIGYLGVLFFLISYQIKSNRALFLLQLIGCLLFAIQFFLLGAATGAISLSVNIIRNILLLKIDSWKWVKNRSTLAGIIVILVFVTIYTWDGPLSLLPFLMVSVTSIGYWTNNAKRIRQSQLIGSPCILIYDIAVGSWGGVLNESITLTSIIVSIIRFGWKALEDPKSNFNKPKSIEMAQD